MYRRPPTLLDSFGLEDAVADGLPHVHSVGLSTTRASRQPPFARLPHRLPPLPVPEPIPGTVVRTRPGPQVRVATASPAYLASSPMCSPGVGGAYSAALANHFSEKWMPQKVVPEEDDEGEDDKAKSKLEMGFDLLAQAKPGQVCQTLRARRDQTLALARRPRSPPSPAALAHRPRRRAGARDAARARGEARGRVGED